VYPLREKKQVAGNILSCSMHCTGKNENILPRTVEILVGPLLDAHLLTKSWIWA